MQSLRNTAPATDQNITTAKTYNADGNLATLTAVNPATGDQTTQYIYGATLADSGIARNDLLRAVIYPDSTNAYSNGVFSTGSNGIYDRVEHRYNRQGEITQTTDQNGTVHAFSYDGLGRQTADAVTTVGTGIDDAVRRIEQSYEVRGMLKHITSYDAATAGNVVNDVQLAYDSFSLLAVDYQAHSGAVNTSTTPKVQYAHADGSGNTTRLTDLTYPNGRVVHYHYNVGVDGNLSRVSYLSDIDANGQKLVEYAYLGEKKPVIVNYPQPSVQLNLFGGTSGVYSGLDRFGRIVDQRWINNSTSPATDAVRIQHGYDRVGNRLYRNDLVSASQTTPVYQDEFYTYDNVNRLVASQRGELNTAKTAIAANTKTLEQGWSLDQLGNWTGFQNDSDGDGAFDLIQTRTHNAANEITALAEPVGATWVSPQYDLAGNMIYIPKPSDPTRAYTLIYDAWGRLVKGSELVNGVNQTVAEYAYDGRNFRVLKKTYSSGVLSEIRHFYYTDDWKLLEERIEASPIPNPQSQIPVSQNVWGVRYIDDLVCRDRTVNNATERLYALQDANWNIVALSDTTGAVQERYTYTSYGMPTFKTATFGSCATSSYDWETLYCGYRWDSLIQSYHVRNRVLLSNLGWWNRRDPIGYKGNINLYEYCGGSPLVRIDPTGLQDPNVFPPMDPQPDPQPSIPGAHGVPMPDGSVRPNGPVSPGVSVPQPFFPPQPLPSPTPCPSDLPKMHCVKWDKPLNEQLGLTVMQCVNKIRGNRGDYLPIIQWATTGVLTVLRYSPASIAIWAGEGITFAGAYNECTAKKCIKWEQCK